MHSFGLHVLMGLKSVKITFSCQYIFEQKGFIVPLIFLHEIFSMMNCKNIKTIFRLSKMFMFVVKMFVVFR